MIVPTTPDGRVQEETLGTIETLRKVGLQPAKLRVLFNRATLDEGEDLDLQFEPVIAYLSVTSGCPTTMISSSSRIRFTRTYALKASHSTRWQTTRPTTARPSTKPCARRRRSPEAMTLIRRLSIHRAVASAKLDLDAAFRALRLPSAQAEALPAVHVGAEE
ncbi:hypothetical protein AWV79_07585 [Cupriavidus sp. UYMMa02A]|nr:hypothetical protein AWV79_07585 [Cupriavidus sp. UYMMa02A]